MADDTTLKIEVVEVPADPVSSGSASGAPSSEDAIRAIQEIEAATRAELEALISQSQARRRNAKRSGKMDIRGGEDTLPPGMTQEQADAAVDSVRDEIPSGPSIFDPKTRRERQLDQAAWRNLQYQRKMEVEAEREKARAARELAKTDRKNEADRKKAAKEAERKVKELQKLEDDRQQAELDHARERVAVIKNLAVSAATLLGKDAASAVRRGIGIYSAVEA